MAPQRCVISCASLLAALLVVLTAATGRADPPHSPARCTANLVCDDWKACISALADTPDFLVRAARLKQDYGAVHVIRDGPAMADAISAAVLLRITVYLLGVWSIYLSLASIALLACFFCSVSFSSVYVGGNCAAALLLQ